MRRPLYGWLTAEAISLLGTRISMVALPWFVLTTTGSPVKTGLVALAEMLPMVLLKVLGGPVIDRVGARRVAITCDLGSMVVVGSIPLLHDAGWLSFGGFLALVAVAGALRGPGDGAKQAMVPELVAAAELPMERVTGLSATVERTASMLGTAAAGVLIAAVGPADALIVDAASFGLSAAVLAWATVSLRRAPVDTDQATGEPEPGEGSYRTRLAEGWRFLRGDRLLLGIAVMVALTNLLDLAYASVLLPVWADDTGRGAAAVGLVFAVFAGASALGSACAAAWAAGLPRYSTYLGAFLLCGAPRFVVLALDAPVAAVLGVCVVGGFASGFLNPVLSAVIFERIPGPLVGRVTSLTTAMCFALMPLGGLLGGALVGWLGLSSALIVVGAAYFLITTAPALDPTWREMDRRPDPGRVPEHAS